jgi:branched-chain amino acid transport system permease protein
MALGRFMQLILNVLVLAALYSLICCGYVLIYRVSRVLNLAHGELMALGGYFLYTISTMFARSPVPAFIVALVMCMILGLVIYFSLMRFMTGQSVLSAVLVTIALGILLRGLMTLVWTAKTWHPIELLGIRNISFEITKGGVISMFGIIAIAGAVLLYLSLFLSLRFTRWGLRMRAVGENPLLASQRGVELHRFYATSWGIAVLTGGFAGMIQACDSSLDPGIFVIGLKAFPVVLVGGLDSLAGVIPAAVIVALAEILAINYISPETAEVAPFFVLLCMLLIRPWGFFGTKEELDRV